MTSKCWGLRFDSKFGFSKHIDKTVKQSNSILFSIWRLGKIGYSKDELAILYRAFVLPKLYYGINVWGGSNVKDLEKINLIQRRAIRRAIQRRAMNQYLQLLEELTKNSTM